MKEMLSTIRRNRYKVAVLTAILCVMLLVIFKLYRHPLAELVTQQVDGYSLSFLLPVALVIFLSLMFWFVMLVLFVKNKKVEQIFLFMGIIFGCVYMIVMPPFTTPDEAVHIDTTYYFSSKLLGQEAVDENGYVLYREGDALYSHDAEHLPSVSSYAKLFHNFFAMDHSEGTVTMQRGPLAISWVAYIPQIIGVTLARLFHLGNIQMLLFGRLFALAFYLACMYLAIQIAPIGKELLMVAGLMPTTMQMVASFSYDSTVLALCFLYTGILLYLTLEAPRVQWYHWVILVVLFAWMSPIKVVYMCMAFTLLIMSKEKFTRGREKYLGILAVVAVGAGMILMTRFSTVTAIGSSSGGMLQETATYSIPYLMEHPIKIFTVLYGTIVGQGTYYLETMIGQYLGWLEITVPGYLIYGFFTLLVLAAIRKTEECQVLGAGQRLWIFLVIAGITVLVGAALLFDWTPIESTYVYGIQGRYLLPMLPLLLVLCKNHQIEMKGSMTEYIATGVYVLQFFTIYHIFGTIVGR